MEHRVAFMTFFLLGKLRPVVTAHLFSPFFAKTSYVRFVPSGNHLGMGYVICHHSEIIY
jgi:hypothetical protein